MKMKEPIKLEEDSESEIKNYGVREILKNTNLEGKTVIITGQPRGITEIRNWRGKIIGYVAFLQDDLDSYFIKIRGNVRGGRLETEVSMLKTLSEGACSNFGPTNISIKGVIKNHPYELEVSNIESSAIGVH